jgi:hypothetical protein
LRSIAQARGLHDQVNYRSHLLADETARQVEFHHKFTFPIDWGHAAGELACTVVIEPSTPPKAHRLQHISACHRGFTEEDAIAGGAKPSSVTAVE